MTRALALGVALVWLVVLVGLGGCLSSQAPSGSQDPYCPKGWKFDVSADGYCSPPTGYTALVWAELGGSGVYGFVRAGSQYLECQQSNDGLPCEVRMIGVTEIDAYANVDVIDTTIRDGATPIATTTSSSQGVYKMRLDPGAYRITGIDPVDGTRFWSANLTIISQALAACAIDVYPP